MKKKNQKYLVIGIISFIVVAIFLAILYFVSYADDFDIESELNPRIDSVSIVVPDANSPFANVATVISVDNPWDMEITIDSLEFKVFYRGDELARGAVNEQIVLPPEGSTSALVNARANFAAFMQRIDEEDLQRIELDIVVTPYATVPVLGATEVTFDFSHTLQLEDDPKVNLHAVHTNIRQNGSLEAEMQMLLEVNDFLPQDVKIEEMYYLVQYEGKKLIEGSRKRDLEIDEDEHTRFRIPATVQLQDLREMYRAMQHQDSITLQVLSNLTITTEDMKRIKVHVDVPQRIVVNVPPEVEVKGVNIKKLDFEEAEFEVELLVHNTTREAVTINNYSYTLHIDGNEWASEEISESIHIPARSSKEVKVPIILETSDVAEAIIENIIGQEDVDYHFEARFNITTQIEMIGSFILTMNARGSSEVDLD